GALECAQALADGGAAQIVVHARTKADGYKPPAHWEWVARVQEVVKVPVFANGEVWDLDDWRRCREISGVEDIMLGRGLVSRPDLALQIAAARAGNEVVPMTWLQLQPMLREFWRQVRGKMTGRCATGRLKQWLAMLSRNYPEAMLLFHEVRREHDCVRVDLLLGYAGTGKALSA
ncbi:MAG: tRNA-dihydrouridine synthase, partial [Pseudomonas sp.]|nr:tRNA-dihydrouridine synthase [Pseudomonas sp.]